MTEAHISPPKTRVIHDTGSRRAPSRKQFIKNSGNPQSTDIQQEQLSSLLDFFRSEADSKSPSTAAAYHQAIRLYAASVSLPYPYITYLALNGYTPKTAAHYNNIILSLLRKADNTSLAELVDASGLCRDSLWLTPADFQSFTRLLKKSSVTQHLTLDTQHLILHSLILAPHIPLASLIYLKKSDLPSLPEGLQDFLAPYLSPKRKYLLPLDQSLLTPRQLREKVEADLRDLFKRHNVPLFGTLDQTIRAYWAFAALRIGHSPSEILNLLPSIPPAIPIPMDGEPAPGRRCDLLASVAASLLSNPEGWFAMRLRPHVSFSELTSRLYSLSGSSASEKSRGSGKARILPPESPNSSFLILNSEISLFYPSEEIARRVGKKIEFQTKPVIPDIVFFRARVTDILPLFSRIGDIAWCYKSDGARGTTYAPIPRRSFEFFQRTIGQFTPDYEVAPIGTLPLRPGDKVELLTGPFSHLSAIVEAQGPRPKAQVQWSAQSADITHSADSPLSSPIYRLHLIGDNGIEWRITARPDEIKSKK